MTQTKNSPAPDDAEDDKKPARERKVPRHDVKVGETGTVEPVDADHSVAAAGADPEAPAPLNAEHLPEPADAYAQNPPPAQVGSREAKEPPTVIAGGPAPPRVDARGMPVDPPAREPGDYQSGTAPTS